METGKGADSKNEETLIGNILTSLIFSNANWQFFWGLFPMLDIKLDPSPIIIINYT